MSIATTSAIASLPKSPPVKIVHYGRIENNLAGPNKQKVCLQLSSSVGRRGSCNMGHSGPLGLCTQLPLDRIRCDMNPTGSSVVCAAALNARCSAEQTQTITREAPTITHVPGKEKSPQLDDGGTGFPPRDDGDGGGGGGGGGGNWSGGFFFFGFLAFLGFLKDKESEGPYQDNRRR